MIRDMIDIDEENVMDAVCVFRDVRKARSKLLTGKPGLFRTCCAMGLAPAWASVRKAR